MLRKINRIQSGVMAKKLRTKINNKDDKYIKNRKMMIDFFIEKYSKDDDYEKYDYYITDDGSCLLSILKNAPEYSNLPAKYCYIECVVSSFDSKYNLKDILNEIKNIYSKHIALSVRQETEGLINHYKKNNFNIIGEIIEDWSSIGFSDSVPCYIMKAN